MSDGERFASKIKLNKKTRCWDWIGGPFTHGYGVFKAKGKTWRAHRFSFVLLKGEIPEGKILHHKCENKLCVLPEHLELVTLRQHPKISTKHNTNKTHCIRGHPLSGSNLYVKPNGKRQCSKCHKDRSAIFLKQNPGKSKEYTYRWRKKYPERYAAYMAKWWMKKSLGVKSNVSR